MARLIAIEHRLVCRVCRAHELVSTWGEVAGERSLEEAEAGWRRHESDGLYRCPTCREEPASGPRQKSGEEHRR